MRLEFLKVKVRSGQVRVYNVHIQSKLLYSIIPPVIQEHRSGTGKQRGEGVRGGGGRCLHWRVLGSTCRPTGIGSRLRVFCVLRCYGIWNVP